MKFSTQWGVVALLAAMLAWGPAANRADAQSQTQTSTAGQTSSSELTKTPNTENSASAAASGSSNFATSGTVTGAQSGAAVGQTTTSMPYLSASPELNGPGSLNYCNARSSCAVNANNCQQSCQHNTLANGTALADSGESAEAASATNFASNDCMAVCQNVYSSCQSAVSTRCSLSQ